MVRCTRCGTTWLAREYKEDPYRQRRPRAIPPPSDVSDAIVIEDIEPADVEATEPLRSGGAQSSSAAYVSRLQPLGAAAGALLAVALLCVPLVGALSHVAGRGGLPADADKLAFQNVTSQSLENRGAETLVVEGDIVNTSTRSVTLPAVRISLKSADGGVVRSWVMEPTAASLAGGGSVSFRSAVLSPETPASEISLSLAAR